ncbi:MAG: pyruvate:ferredoxin (flavodoxin) oxidoreductase [Planctomycetes bacterium]|nr:pyruvate:ferredoxin (flavodoxin) oxidoreductase [Planctomycetota bacterium]
MRGQFVTLDGNEAVAHVAHRSSEVIAIYPITPSSSMGELSDEWSAHHRPNLWGQVPEVIEMQSEAGAAGAVHGALQAGSLATTFTASQGLLLMIPNMYKIAGELTSFCMHVAARTLATHALSIFGDHSDVMACRQTGFAMLCSSSVQEAHDFACVAHAATLDARVPFLHFFDGFRTSHEVAKIELVPDDVLRSMYSEQAIAAHRARGLSPDHPQLRGSAQNPDTFFQAREACNSYYDACVEHVQRAFDRFAELTGRRYRLFDYVGDPHAERVLVMMGSGAEAAHETVEHLVQRGEKVGLVKVRLFRPFSLQSLVRALPVSVRAIAVLDRTKEPGSTGEPLYLDVLAALREEREAGKFAADPRIVGGRYGLSSKEFTPAMVKAVLDELVSAKPRNHFTIGIHDDVTQRSLAWDEHFDLEPADVVRAQFWGLGADGTVGANKNSIKIIGEGTELFAQGYFVYDSKKSGSITISHLRFGPRPIRSTYLVSSASFVACHQFGFLERYDVLGSAAPGSTLLLNSPYAPERLWDELPVDVQETVLEKKIQVWTIDAAKVAHESGMKNRINTVMQTCFFAISGVLPREQAIAKIKAAIQKTYGKKGQELVERNFAAVDAALAHLHRVEITRTLSSTRQRIPAVTSDAPDFVQRVTAAMIEGHGDALPVSAFPPDGTWPMGTSRFEKRNIAAEIPVWDTKICIQCNKCALFCPHAAIRAKVYEPAALAGAPATFKCGEVKGGEFAGSKYTIQVAPEDCTGCGLCVAVCPAKDKANPRHKAIDMAPQPPLLAAERENFSFFLGLPEPDRTKVKLDNKGTQLLEPLFEFSGACSGCGETPYIKLLTQVFGDRMLIANATGCSSIYGGNLPTTPYCTNRDGRGPAWANSLFEDNAEFGLGMRLGVDALTNEARALVKRLAESVGSQLADALLACEGRSDAELAAQRARVVLLRQKLVGLRGPEALRLEWIADYLVRKSVWLIGGDGWAYDIGFGGLDHVISQGRDVNILVLDTEVYSNTGGQASKSTPRGAAAKFAVAGKSLGKKDLALMAMSYGHVYVARIAMGAKDAQTVKALIEAESYPGPSLVIAYSHCIAHGYDMAFGAEQQKLAVSSGSWPLYRFDPRRTLAGEPALQLDGGEPTTALGQYMRNETRFRMVEQDDPARFKAMLEETQAEIRQRWNTLQRLAAKTPEPAAPTQSAALKS